MEKNEKLEQLIIEEVDEQLETGEPEVTTSAYGAFRAMGLGDLEAKQMIGAALVTEMCRMMETDDEFDEERYAGTLVDMIKGQWNPGEPEEIPEHPMLKDALLISNDDELLNMMADEYGIVPSEDAEDTAEEIASYLLKPEKMEEMILGAREGTADLVEKMLEYPETELSDQERDLLEDSGDLEDCLLFAGDGRILVPEDVAEVWCQVHTEAFEEKRKKHVWLRSCVETAAYYYGVFDINALISLAGQSSSLKLKKEEIRELLDEMPECRNLFMRFGDRFVERDLTINDFWKELVNIQGDYPFVIPSEQEIQDIGFYHYPYHEAGWRDLRKFIEGTELDFIAADILPVLFHRVTIEDNEEDVEGILEEEEVMPDDDDFGRIWTLIYGNTRLLALRGGKRSEGKQPAKLSEELFDSLLTMEDRMDGAEPENETRQLYS